MNIINEEEKWLKNIKSNKRSLVLHAIETITPDIANKYKNIIEETIRESEGAEELVTSLPFWYREENSDICVEVFKKHPELICYIPEKVVADNPKYLDSVPKEVWTNMIKEGQYTNMPLKVFESFDRTLIVKNFDIHRDGTSKLSQEICQKSETDSFYQSLIDKVFIEALRSEDIDVIEQGLPLSIIEKYKSRVERIGTILTKQREAENMLMSARNLLEEVDEAIENVITNGFRDEMKEGGPQLD